MLQTAIKIENTERENFIKTPDSLKRLNDSNGRDLLIERSTAVLTNSKHEQYKDSKLTLDLSWNLVIHAFNKNTDSSYSIRVHFKISGPQPQKDIPVWQYILARDKPGLAG